MRIALSAFAMLMTLAACHAPADRAHNSARLEPVAALDINPGNAAVAPNGRIFATLHDFRKPPLHVVEITGYNSYRPFPNASWNRTSGPSSERWVAPLGIRADGEGNIWVIDSGSKTLPPKLVAFREDTGDLVYRYEFPAALAAPGGFAQDIAVDARRGFVYVADAGGDYAPGLIVVDTLTNQAHRIEGIQAFDAENIDMVVDRNIVVKQDRYGNWKPARIALDPITLSADGEVLYFGAMHGTSWYAVPTSALRDGASSAEVDRLITRVGSKPLSDGAATDAAGNHYFTDPEHHAITRMDTQGKLSTLVSSPELTWPDSAIFGPDNVLYVATNQLHRSPPLNYGREVGVPPYMIYRVVP